RFYYLSTALSKKGFQPDLFRIGFERLFLLLFLFLLLLQTCYFARSVSISFLMLAIPLQIFISYLNLLILSCFYLVWQITRCS
ncbi:MAG: hypothetical protein KZQ77_13790, partial [Candidatus Thiodiazotropha sp. (ex Notomyrtea botanica)]|nr:hypothetical protein [Candidatus Thiodiazotropha sp. (ex Notomyrtea botanica)]